MRIRISIIKYSVLLLLSIVLQRIVGDRVVVHHSSYFPVYGGVVPANTVHLGRYQFNANQDEHLFIYQACESLT